MRNRFITGTAAAFSAVFITGCATSNQKELVDYIKPSIGNWTLKEGKSHGGGKTFPGPATPFGMVQLGPDNVTGGDEAPGYSYHYDTIEGFSFTRLNGAGWYGEFGNLQVMPTTGELITGREEAKSKFRHETEVVKAGYYAVELDRYKIRTELTAAPRAGMLRFTFPESQNSRIKIDLARRIGQKEGLKKFSMQKVEIVDDHTIKGLMYCPASDGGWGRGSGNCSYTFHFYAQFDKPIKNFGMWDNKKIVKGQRSFKGMNSGFFVEFPTKDGEQVLMKSGISFVSTDGAKKNLEHDIPHWDFDKVVSEARELWSNALNRVAVEGGTEDQKTIFATALYHSYLDPRVVSDIDGKYIGADNKVHTTGDFSYRSLFSGWDVFRSQFPFLTLTRPDIVNDEVNSLMQMAKLSGKGYMPRWEIMNTYSGCMLGDPGVGVIAEAYRKGIRNYDVEEAYKICRTSMCGVEKIGHAGRRYDEKRVIASKQQMTISLTLENAFFDHCLASFASDLGKKEDAAKLFERSKNYASIWDPSVYSMRAKNWDGTWKPWLGELVYTGGPKRLETGCIESNPLQQGWFVPHDVQGLINLHGGDEQFLKKLENFFVMAEPDMHDWSDYYNHANEPNHQIVYMFPYAGKPWLTQKWARKVMEKSYGTGVRGLCGNEDMGQMSAWYLLSSMGFHPVDTSSGVYIIGSPLFDKVSITFDSKYYKGKKLDIIAKNNSDENIYVQSLSLNGKAVDRAWVTHDELTAGGELVFVMGPKPNKQWATAKELRPPSLTKQ